MSANSAPPRSADPVSPNAKTEPMQLVNETTPQTMNHSEEEDGNPISPTTNEFNSAAQPSLSLRSIVTTKEAGVVIGKSGKNVSDIRERSGAKITISEMVQGAFERILIVSGPLDTVAKAYSLIARKILEEVSENNPTSNTTMRTTAVRLLVPNNRMGSVIGKGGSKIKEIQEASGARLVASEEMLQGSTERTITVAGVPDSVHIAVYHVGLILQQHSERSAGTIPYKPTAKFGGGSHGSAPYGGGSPVDPYAPPAGYGGHYPPQGGPSHYQGGGPPRNSPGGPSAPGSQAQQIFIPNDMVGCIIGKNGSKINEIRHLSGSHIKIGEPHGNNNERLVTITGTPDANQMALYLLYSRLEAEKGRMAANT